MNPWKKLHNDFNALKEAEDWIARARVAVAQQMGFKSYSQAKRRGGRR